jgi:hypothetical protein
MDTDISDVNMDSKSQMKVASTYDSSESEKRLLCFLDNAI